MEDNKLSAYERKRYENVQKNQAKLQELGLLQATTPRRNPSRKRTALPVLPRSVEPRVQRRSKRVAVAEVRNEVHERLIASDLSEQKATTALVELPSRHVVKYQDPIYIGVPHVDVESLCSQTGEKLSSSQLNMHVEGIHESWIGHQITPKGKFAVMLGLCSTEHIPSFGRMSGIQPWKNGAVLFVNIDDETRYKNVFEVHAGMKSQRICFNWYAQNRHKETSSVIARLIADTKRGDPDLWIANQAQCKTEHPFHALLFGRLQQGPYVYFGRLACLGHKLTQPLHFKWQLLDAHNIRWNYAEFLGGSAESFMSQTKKA